MANLINNIQNNALAALTSRAPQGVVNAIKQASVKTGVNFAYLVQQAGAESSFQADAKAKTSSASGLYQFIERTWLSMVDKHGAKHGLETDGKTRGELLELRNDPRAASLMAAEFASENEQFLNSHWGGEVGSTELYFAHFLGAGGASAFLNARDSDPTQAAATLFPAAAKANRNVFYDRSTGRAKTLDEIYAHFDNKFSIEGGDVQIAEAPQAQPKNHNSLAGKKALMDIYGQQYSNSVVRRTAGNPMGFFNVTSPVEIMMMAQLDVPGRADPLNDETQRRTNRLFSHNSSYNQ